MAFPQHWIDELLGLVPIEEVMGKYIKLTHISNGRLRGDYLALCPFHAERSPSFTVCPSKGFFHCFGCGSHGNALDFLMSARKMTFHGAVRALATVCKLPPPGGTWHGKKKVRKGKWFGSSPGRSRRNPEDFIEDNSLDGLYILPTDQEE